MEKRKATRIPSDLPARCEGDLGIFSGTVRELSTRGCFVSSAGLVAEKDLVRLFFAPPEGGEVCLWGEVTARREGVGFGVRFTGLTEEREAALRRLVDEAYRRAAADAEPRYRSSRKAKF